MKCVAKIEAKSSGGVTGFCLAVTVAELSIMLGLAFWTVRHVP